MSFVSGLFGGGAQSAQIDKGATTDQAKQIYDQQQQALNQQQAFASAVAQQNGLQNQNSVYQQLAGIANGTGPSVAQAQLAQSTQANVANQAALMAGGRGSSQNAGLIARQAAMAGANAQQQAIGQNATLRAQEQQNAIGQMGALATNQVGQQQAALSNLSGATNTAQSNVLGAINGQNNANVAMQSNVNNNNTAMAQASMQMAGKLAGGVASGGSSMLMAHGGMVPGHGRFVEAYNQAHGMKAEPKMMSEGGPVPGQALVPGDSLKNDTQPTMLSPGEVVIPRSVMMSKDPLKAATEFLKQVMDGKGPRPQQMSGKQALNSGGDVIRDLEKDQRMTPDNPDYTYQPTANDYRMDTLKDAASKLTPDFVGKAADALSQPPDYQAMSQAMAGDVRRDSGMGGPGPVGSSGSWDDSAPQSPGQPNQPMPAGVAAQAPQGATGQDPYGFDQMMKQTQGGLGEMRSGINMQANAEGKAADAQAKASQAHIDEMGKVRANYEQHYNELEQERQQFKQALASGKVDPNHYLSSRSSGQKVSQAIGLLLGGIGGGLLGTENPALAYLNKQIDRDIEGQKAEIGKNENLLSQNLKQFGNLNDATAATRAMISDVYQTQIQKAAQDSGSEAAKARAMQAAGKLDIDSASTMRTLAMQKAMMSGQQSPEAMMQYARMTNPTLAKDMEGRYVPGIGMASVPVSETARKEITARQDLSSKLGQLEQFAKLHSGSLDPKVIAAGKALSADVQNAYRTGNAMGVFKEGEQGFVEKIIDSDPTKLAGSLRTIPGYQVTRKNNEAQLGSLLKAHGLSRPNIAFTPGK